MKVLPLKGLRSLRVLNAFSALMLGLKMLPAYMSSSYEDFMATVDEMPPHDQEKLIREAALFVEIAKDELEAVLSFVPDANGVPIGKEQISGMGPKEIHEAVVAVMMEVAKIKVTIVSDDEKKN